MCDMTENEFETYCPNGWWRSSDGSNMGIPETKIKINGKEIIAWKDEEFGLNKYYSLTEYLCNCLGASQPRNVCALATDLAQYNNIKMSELFTKYEIN